MSVYYIYILEKLYYYYGPHGTKMSMMSYYNSVIICSFTRQHGNKEFCFTLHDEIIRVNEV